MLGIRGFDLDRVLEVEPEFLDTAGEHVHDQSVTSVGFNQVRNDVSPIVYPSRSAVLIRRGTVAWRELDLDSSGAVTHVTPAGGGARSR